MADVIDVRTAIDMLCESYKDMVYILYTDRHKFTDKNLTLLVNLHLFKYDLRTVLIFEFALTSDYFMIS